MILFVQRGITDFGRQMRARLLVSGVDVRGLLGCQPCPAHATDERGRIFYINSENKYNLSNFEVLTKLG